MNYYKLNFLMMQMHKYNLGDLEHMIPWEREVYVGMLVNHLKEEADRINNKG